MKKSFLLLCAASALAHSMSAQIKDLPVQVVDTLFCGIGAANLNVDNSQLGVNYTFRYSNNSTLMGPLAGTGQGNTIGISFPVSATETYNVLAEAVHSAGIQFDGSNDYLAVDSLSFDYSQGYTYEAWVKSPNPSTGYYNPVLAVGVPGISDIEIYVRPGDLMVLYDRGRPSISEHRFPLPPNNTWFHLAVTFNGATTKVYYDGVEQTVLAGSTASGTLVRTPNASVQFGYAPNITTTVPHQKYMDGSIDEIRIWSDARTASDISSNMSACQPAGNPNLKYYYRLNGTTGSATATDQVVGRNATLTNMDLNNVWTIVETPLSPCPSTATMQLSQTPTIHVIQIDNSVSQTGATLTATMPGQIYQWMDCNTLSNIPGANSQSYTATTNGSYAVVITGMGGCSDTSACQLVSLVGLSEISNSRIDVFPNPSEGAYKVRIEPSWTDVDLQVTNLLGQQVPFQVQFEGEHAEVQMDGPAGVYMLHVQNGSSRNSIRIVKK